MKSALYPITAVALAIAATAAPALAEVQQPAPNTARGAALATSVEANAPMGPHYEWRYHYVGRHPRFEGYWALVR